jgi:hypothetical protein
MGTVDLPKSGRAVRKEAWNTYLPQKYENRQECLERILREEAAGFSARLAARLPAEAVPRLDEKVYNFISRNYRLISDNFNFPEDAIAHSVKNIVTEISAVLESYGGADHFNTGEIEKTLASRQWGIGDLETHTNNMLRRKTGVGSFVDSQKINSVITCVFKDNAKKPKTVTDLRFAVNMPETELIDPIFRFQARSAYLIREVICKRLSESIDEKDNDYESVENILNGSLDISPLVLDEHLLNIDMNDDIEAIRDKGFSAASNLLVSTLDSLNLSCQFLENRQRELLIREYEDTDEANLPDEHYQIRLSYFNRARLLEERGAYDERLKILGGEARRLWDLLEVIYQDSKSVFKVNDFDDLARKNKSRLKNFTNYDPREITEVPLAAAQGEKEKIRILLARMEERIKNMYDNMYPSERSISEERLSMLRNEFSLFENSINPHNLQPGILVDISLTSIKRKRTTLDAMAAALARFLDNVSNGFHEAAQIAAQVPAK